MKAVLAALALSVAAVSTPVLAQGHDQHGAPAPAAQQRHDAKPAKVSKQERHVRACKAKYRNYDIKRDAYRGPGGKWIKCRL